MEDGTSPDKCPVTTKLVLDEDKESKEKIEVYKKIICKLKPHQVDGEWEGLTGALPGRQRV